MSVGIATMGMFSSCCRSEAGGGGAPPYRQEEERVKPRVLVTKFEVEDINILDRMIQNIDVKFIGIEDQEE